MTQNNCCVFKNSDFNMPKVILLVFVEHNFDIMAYHFIKTTSPPTESGIVKFYCYYLVHFSVDKENINLNLK